jgi:hypothetical protein
VEWQNVQRKWHIYKRVTTKRKKGRAQAEREKVRRDTLE